MTDYITGAKYSEEEIQEYLNRQKVVEYLNEGCIELAKERPACPVEWLGRWLLRRNKRKPVVEDGGADS